MTSSTIDPRSTFQDMVKVAIALDHTATAGTLWAITAAQARRTLPILSSIPWSLQVFDEAHWSAQRMLSRTADTPVLLLTATPGALPRDLVLPTFRINGPGFSGVLERTVDVEPNQVESEFLRAVVAWLRKGDDSAINARRQRILRLCRTGVLPAIETLETLASLADRPDEPTAATDSFLGVSAPIQLDAEQRAEVDSLLELAYQVPLPDTRSVAFAGVLREQDQSLVVVIASRNSQLSYLSSLFHQVGIRVSVLSSISDPGEAATALLKAKQDGVPLLIGDGAASQGVGEGRSVLIHGDVPTARRVASRVGLVVDSSDPRPAEVTSIVVRWTLPGLRSSRE